MLRDDALAAELAGVVEHDRTVRLDVLAQRDPARSRIGEPLLAFLKLKRSLILAVQFEQVEGIQDDVTVTTTGVQLVGTG